jgi:hypothetical protein
LTIPSTPLRNALPEGLLFGQLAAHNSSATVCRFFVAAYTLRGKVDPAGNGGGIHACLTRHSKADAQRQQESGKKGRETRGIHNAEYTLGIAKQTTGKARFLTSSLYFCCRPISELRLLRIGIESDEMEHDSYGKLTSPFCHNTINFSLATLSASTKSSRENSIFSPLYNTSLQSSSTSMRSLPLSLLISQSTIFLNRTWANKHSQSE